MRSFVCTLLGGCLLAAARAEEPQALREARQALAENVPEIALLKARPLAGAKELSPQDRDRARLLSSEALAAVGKAEDALTMLQPLTATGYDRATLLKAGILASEGRWAEALPLYHSATAMADAPAAARLGEIEALVALERGEEALGLLEAAVTGGRADALTRIRYAVLLIERGRKKPARDVLNHVQPGPPEETKWKSYADGRLLLLDDQPAPALTIFEGLLQDREHLPESLHVAATFGATDARIALYGTDAADSVLETFIWRNPQSPWLEAVFRRLDQVYMQEEDPGEIELHKWATKPLERRAALASFYVGKLQVHGAKWEKAISSLNVFLQTHPKHPLRAQAEILQAHAYTATGDYPAAVRALEEAMRLAKDADTRSEIEFRMGLANFQQGEHLLSATLFESAARHSATIRPVSTFNAALAWLHQGNFDRFGEQQRAFAKLRPESPLNAELLLEAGLQRARANDPAALPALQKLVREQPRAERQAEARVAVAELAFLRGQPEPGLLTGDELIRTSSVPVAPETAAAADYLAVFQADAQQPRDDEKVIALAESFLREHPQAGQAPEVRMKLGQVYFRREDYANAETQFATLADENTGSAYTEAALYLAGESAMKLINSGAINRSLKFFDRVVEMEGAFKLYARQEQAIVQSRLEHQDQAIVLYDLILAAQPPPDPDLRHAALCGKGDNLVALGRRELPAREKVEQAIGVYRTLADSPGVPPAWRNQALYQMGKALELIGRGEESLGAFYDVLNRTTAEEREFFWFFKAGFDAARLFEQQEKWKSAAGIYQKMARIEGPRTAEAQARLRQIRLEHFLWE
jgi:tetratricopeptide (TPR) repeat protein